MDRTRIRIYSFVGSVSWLGMKTFIRIMVHNSSKIFLLSLKTEWIQSFFGKIRIPIFTEDRIRIRIMSTRIHNHVKTMHRPDTSLPVKSIFCLSNRTDLRLNIRISGSISECLAKYPDIRPNIRISGQISGYPAKYPDIRPNIRISG